MSHTIFVNGGVRNELVIVLHGLKGTPKLMQDVLDAAHAARPDADVLALPLAFSGRLGAFAIRPAECVAADVVECIDAAINARADNSTGGAYERIVLVGYSFGAVIARKVAIIAHGEQHGADFEPLIEKFRRQPRHWATQIERIVMLGGMNRGWSPAAARNWITAAKWALGSLWGELMATITRGWGRPTIFGIRQGAPFIVQTRLQWLALARSGSSRTGGGNSESGKDRVNNPQIVGIQLLGAADDLVAPDDSVDYACDFRGDPSSPFALIETPFATHGDAYCMKRPTAVQRTKVEQALSDGKLSEVCKRDNLALQARWILFGRAVSQTIDQLSDIKIDPRHMTDMPALHTDPEATDVVFVIHGIRDHGYWTQKIARVIKQEVERENHGKRRENCRHFRSFTGSYGYFAMAPFVLPWVRRWKSEWLMDRYVEIRARHPNAVISFVGHSNGTYLLARALTDCPAVCFGRVVLAGSVIRRDFDWAKHLEPKLCSNTVQVREILNYVATKDWVVAIFSKAFQPLRFFFDLGSAGHDGFDQYKNKKHPRLHEVHFIDGSHSAALAETQWNSIASFIVKGSPIPGPPDTDFKLHRSRAMVALGWVSPLILLLLLCFVIGIGVALTLSVPAQFAAGA